MEKIIPWGLLIAQLKHESTPEQDVLFDAWIKETDNAGLFADITLLWDKIQEEVSEAKPDLAVSWEKMQTRIHAGQHKQRNLRRIKYSVISIAASILLLLGIGYSYQFVRQYNTNQYYSALNGKSRIILPDSSVVWLNTGSGDILNLAAGITNDYYLIQIQGVFFQDDIEITLVRYRDNLFSIADIRNLYRAVFR